MTGADADTHTAESSYPKGATPRRHFVAVALLFLVLVFVAVGAVGAEKPETLLLFAPLTVAAAAGLLTRRSWGYWVAVAASALLVMLGVLGVSGDPDLSGFLVLAVLALPLPFLVFPASWRWLRAQRAVEARPRASAGSNLPRPAGWTDEQAGGGCMLVVLLGVGALLLVSAVGVTVDHSGDAGAVRLGVAIASLGAMIMLAAPLFSSRRGGRVRLVHCRTPTGRQLCLRFPTSRLRVVGLLAGLAFLLVSGIGFLTVTPVAVGLGANPWPVAVFGAIFATVGVVALIAKLVPLRHGIDTDLTPTEVRLDRSAPVPWEHIAAVEADEFVSYTRGGRIVDPFIRLILRSEAAQPPGCPFPRGARLFDAQKIRVRMLAVEPRLLYHALRWYHSNPDARAELADERSVDRIQRCDLRPSGL